MEKSKLIIILMGTLLVAGCGHYTPAQKEYIAWRDYCDNNPTPKACLDAMSPGGGASQGSGGGHGGGHGK